MTPSSPAPSNRENQSVAIARSVVAGVRWTGGLGVAQHRLEPGAPLALGHAAEVLVVEREQVPRDEARGRLGREHAHARRRRVDPEQQGLEGEGPVLGDDDLAVQDAPLGQRRAQRVGQLGEVAVQRLEVAGLRVHLVAITEDEGPEPVPFGLEQPAVVGREPVHGLGQHRLERRLERQVQGHRVECTRGHRPRTEPRSSGRRLRDAVTAVRS